METRSSSDSSSDEAPPPLPPPPPCRFALQLEVRRRRRRRFAQEGARSGRGGSASRFAQRRGGARCYRSFAQGALEVGAGGCCRSTSTSAPSLSKKGPTGPHRSGAIRSKVKFLKLLCSAYCVHEVCERSAKHRIGMQEVCTAGINMNEKSEDVCIKAVYQSYKVCCKKVGVKYAFHRKIVCKKFAKRRLCRLLQSFRKVCTCLPPIQ